MPPVVAGAAQARQEVSRFERSSYAQLTRDTFNKLQHIDMLNQAYNKRD